MATFDERTGFTFIPFGELDEIHESIISSVFDEQVDYDVEELKMEMDEKKLLKKVCLLKTLMFPVELSLTAVILGGIWTNERKESQKLYWKFLRNKITLKQFKEEMFKLSQELLKKE